MKKQDTTQRLVMEHAVKDKFGNELKIGDNVCFTISMRKDQKPIVRAKIAGFIYGNNDGCNDYAVLGDYTEEHDSKWAANEKKLISKVVTHRVVKCY